MFAKHSHMMLSCLWLSVYQSIFCACTLCTIGCVPKTPLWMNHQLHVTIQVTSVSHECRIWHALWSGQGCGAHRASTALLYQSSIIHVLLSSTWPQLNDTEQARRSSPHLQSFYWDPAYLPVFDICAADLRLRAVHCHCQDDVQVRRYKKKK